MSCHHKDPRPNIFSHQKRRTLGVCADFEFITEYSHVFGVSKPCETNLVDSLCGVVETSAFHPLVTASPHCFQPKTVCGVRRAWVVAWKALQIDAAKVGGARDGLIAFRWRRSDPCHGGPLDSYRAYIMNHHDIYNII